jgi:hypothetical protein
MLYPDALDFGPGLSGLILYLAEYGTSTDLPDIRPYPKNGSITLSYDYFLKLQSTDTLDKQKTKT